MIGRLALLAVTAVVAYVVLGSRDSPTSPGGDAERPIDDVVGLRARLRATRCDEKTPLRRSLVSGVVGVVVDARGQGVADVEVVATAALGEFEATSFAALDGRPRDRLATTRSAADGTFDLPRTSAGHL